MRSDYLIAIRRNELLQALDCLSLLIIGSEVKNLGHCAVVPGLKLYFSARFLLGQGGSVVWHRDTSDYEPFSLWIEMSIRIASTRAAYFERLQSPLLQVKL